MPVVAKHLKACERCGWGMAHDGPPLCQACENFLAPLLHDAHVHRFYQAAQHERVQAFERGELTDSR